MRLLIVTQAIDTEDPVLGFFHRWLEEFSTRFERIEAICLREGKHALPGNVRVHSLGKEQGVKGRLTYSLKFISLIWRLRDEYDVVLVHMNQEYVLIGGPLWDVLGKRVYMWRNHYAGSFLTDIAASFCRKVFCTSKHSYTAKYKKTVLMPVGVDTARFFEDGTPRTPRSILFFGRMAESKRPGMVVDALIELAKRGVDFTASFVGSALSHDEPYLAALKQRVADAGLMGKIVFSPGIPNAEAPALYRRHQIYVNASPSGMFDKTIFEAAASGCVVLATSADWKDIAGNAAWFSDAAALTNRLEETLQKGRQHMPPIAPQSLVALSEALIREIQPVLQ